MKPIVVNKRARITEGVLEDYEGLVVAADAETQEVWVELYEGTLVVLNRDKVHQDTQV